jgi:hypothetical protein
MVTQIPSPFMGEGKVKVIKDGKIVYITLPLPPPIKGGEN